MASRPESTVTSLDLSTAMVTHPVRETPAPEPLHAGLTDPAHSSHLDETPVIETDQIQGNIVGGFNKDFQTMLFLEIVDAREFQAWLGSQVKFVATSAEVLAFNRLFKWIRQRRQKEVSAVKATWMNIAFSYHGLDKMKSVVPSLLKTDFLDAAFKAGVAKRAATLGDPTDSSMEGHPDNWVVGGTHNAADVVVIVASDDHEDLSQEVTRIEDSLYAVTMLKGRRVTSGARIIYKQNGANLPGALAGHEHFGFLDGVSQPGIRGLLSTDPHDVLTSRQNPLKRAEKNASGKLVTAQGKPGQDLLWAGEFVFGYPTQVADEPNSAKVDGPNPAKGPLSDAGPAWAKNGSFLVFRRLRQDVGAFHRFLHKAGHDHQLNPDFVGAQLVGRWASGAPVLRSPAADNASLGNVDCANNNFEFGGDADPLPPASDTDPFACTDDNPHPPPTQFPPARGDKEGVLCPFTGHIRKAYPRDDTSTSVDSLNESSTQTHRLLRRGIPFGEASASTPHHPQDDNVDRGLLFLAYQTSIERQFEFVMQNWVNNKNFKEPFGSSATPAQKRGGPDPIIGQNNSDKDRVREFTIVTPNQKGIRLSTEKFDTKDWVIPTGGGYFFAPSIDALEQLAGHKPLR